MTLQFVKLVFATQAHVHSEWRWMELPDDEALDRYTQGLRADGWHSLREVRIKHCFDGESLDAPTYRALLQQEIKPDQREGQRAFNLLNKMHPMLAREIASSLFDPFYRDERLSDFFSYVERNWDKYPLPHKIDLSAAPSEARGV